MPRLWRSYGTLKNEGGSGRENMGMITMITSMRLTMDREEERRMRKSGAGRKENKF
jgi:hypothetical protein